MSFDPNGYVLSSDDGPSVWFLDTRMTVKAGGEETRGAFTFLEWAAPAGFGPPRHLHNEEDEAFYVLSGRLVVECGEGRWEAGAGGFVFLPAALRMPSSSRRGHSVACRSPPRRGSSGSSTSWGAHRALPACLSLPSPTFRDSSRSRSDTATRSSGRPCRCPTPASRSSGAPGTPASHSGGGRRQDRDGGGGGEAVQAGSSPSSSATPVTRCTANVRTSSCRWSRAST